MFVQQLYTNCLSEAAYYIESNGEAAIIDPLRDIDEYLQLAKQRNTTIKYIFETHFHADFVSGHLELAAATGATIVYGPNAQCNFKAHVAKDNETFTIGNISLKVLHTPGHTLESCCYLLIDENRKDYAVFTGDTLFVGDVGRPDLAQKDEELTTNDLAGILFDSLHSKIISLADDVIVYPAHGAGSSCGKNLGAETFSTIGEQKQSNYALQPQTKEEFIKAVTEGLEAPPPYFFVDAKINKEGYDKLEGVLQKSLKPLPVKDFKEAIQNDDLIILDTRPADIFVQGFIPDSIFIGLEGRFAEWAGNLLPFKTNIVLVTEQGKEQETVTRLARVGFDNIEGYLAGGFKAWKKAGETVDMLVTVDPDELAMDIHFDNKLLVVDVRKETEFADGHIKDAINLPLSEFTDPATIAGLDESYNLYIHCAGGYRSVIASSLLKQQGIHNIHNINGGWEKMMEIKDQFKVEKEEVKA